jgi:hypothetical protein
MPAEHTADTCLDPTTPTAAEPDAGRVCTAFGDLLRDLTSTRVCPAVYRLALLQGRLPPPPPILRAWCVRGAVAEEGTPRTRLRGLFARAGLRWALAACLGLRRAEVS